MSVLINIVLPVFLIISLAALAQTRLRLEVRTLSRVVFYLFSPALVFDSLSNSDVSSSELGQILAVLVLSTGVLWILGILAARVLRLQGPTQAAFLVAILIMNAGNFGLSVNYFAYGDPGVTRATVCFTFSAILASSLGVFLSARGRVSTGTALRRAVSVPLFYAALVGLAFNLGGWAVPEPLAKAINLLGQAAVPGMLVVLGLKLAETIKNGQRVWHLPALGTVAVTRLIVAPALAWLFAGFLGLQGLARDVTVLESAMPTAVITTILATEFDSDAPFAALCVLITTLSSLVSITVLLNLLT